MTGKRGKGRGDFSKKAGLLLLVIWTALLAGATLCSLAYERKMMPEIVAGYPGEGEVSYSCAMEAEVVGADEAEMLVPRSMHLPSRMFGEGKDVGIGTVISSEKGDTDFLVKIQLKEPGTVGAVLPVTLSDTAVYDQVMDNRCIHRDDYGRLCVFEIVESEGAWGTEYRLSETMAVCFPDDISVNPVAVYTELHNKLKANLLFLPVLFLKYCISSAISDPSFTEQFTNIRRMPSSTDVPVSLIIVSKW